MMNRPHYKIPSALFQKYAFPLAAYSLVSFLTRAHFMSDTVDYADDIVQGKLWEFGHLFLRPLGFVLFRLLAPISRSIVGPDSRTGVVFTLITLNWAAGLLSVLMLYGLASRLTGKRWVASITVAAFIISHGFLNYAHAGCAYVLSLSLILVGLYALANQAGDEAVSWQRAVGAGLALAAAVCLWFPYILAVPGALLLPLILFKRTSARVRLVIVSSVAFALIAGAAYAIGAAALGIHSVAAFKAWAVGASDGRTQSKIASTVIFGLSRSFINMGADGVVFKRFLLHDALNPVSLVDIVRLSLWKVTLFYLFLISIVVNLLRSGAGRRMIGFLGITAVPVIGFAALWDAGSIERYLPLFPPIFVALAYSLYSDRSSRLLNAVALSFFAAAAVSNLSVMALPVQAEREQATVSRIGEMLPLLKPHSQVVTLNDQDEVRIFSRTFPFNPINSQGSLSTFQVIRPATAQALEWRELFASRAVSVLNLDGDVWVSTRMFSPRPKPEWSWAEGDDRRVSWNDIYAFFSRLETEGPIGGEDGFARLSPSAKNTELLGSLAAQVHPAVRDDLVGQSDFQRRSHTQKKGDEMTATSGNVSGMVSFGPNLHPDVRRRSRFSRVRRRF
jgi:hypothetical protein